MSQSIEEFLVKKVIKDKSHLPLNSITHYHSSSNLFSVAYLKTLEDSEQDVTYYNLPEIIKLIKAHEDINKPLFDELINLFPEYMI